MTGHRPLNPRCGEPRLSVFSGRFTGPHDPPRPTASFSKIGGSEGNRTLISRVQTGRSPVELQTQKICPLPFLGTGQGVALSAPVRRPTLNPRPGARTPGLGWREGETVFLYGARGRNRTSNTCMSHRRYAVYLRGHGRARRTRTAVFLHPKQAGWPLPYSPN